MALGVPLLRLVGRVWARPGEFFGVATSTPSPRGYAYHSSLRS